MSEDVRTQAELRASLEFTQNEVTELKIQLSNVNITATQMSSLDAGLQKLSGTVDYLENQFRRSNLRIARIAEIPDETWAQTEEAVCAKLTKELNILEETSRNISTERAHRVCCNGAAKTRMVVVKFEKYKEKELVLQAARENLPKGLYFNEDYSQRVVDKRKELLQKLREARQQGKVAYLSFDKLVIKNLVTK